MRRRAAFLALLILHCASAEERRAPWLVLEPAARVQYAAARGARLRCAARGHPPPRLDWLGAAGAPLPSRPGVRRVLDNGTLEVAAGAGGAAFVVRCRARNALGVALSRDVTLLPVGEEPWEVSLQVSAAAAGGVAALACRASAAADFVRPELWYHDDRPLHIPPPTAEARYVRSGDTLLVRALGPRDAGRYACRARHRLSAAARRSPPALLQLREGRSNSAPRLVSPAAVVSVEDGAAVCLSCLAGDGPPPQYTWYREVEGRLRAVEAGDGAWAWGGGAALCLSRASPDAAGAWLCKAYNAYGEATAHLRLEVRAELTASVTPALAVVRAGGSARFECAASERGAALRWLHDGAALAAGGAALRVRAARAAAGVYQCVARLGDRSAQAAAELRLSEWPPELHYTFIEQALRPGGAVSLRCAAWGAPPPAVRWLWDGLPLAPRDRLTVSEETSPTGDVVSALNISSVAETDGGRYTCRATNAHGAAEHSARLNVYGPPSIRALGPVRVVAGDNATVYCPYAGYPISSISWWRRGASAALGGAGRVAARGAELRLRPALAADAGHYECAAAAPGPLAPAARADIEIQVRNPPKISPFIFSSELTEGSSVQVLCGVSSGDKPMYFSWLKDGSPLPSDLQIEEKNLNEFSLLMFSELSARHSGAYTCRVANHAAVVNYTATLSVKVAPAWVTEPLDAAVLLGAPLLLECAAKGSPTPTVTWYRRIGEAPVSENEQWERLEPWVGTGNGAENGTQGGAGSPAGSGVGSGSVGAAAAARLHQGLYRCIAENGVGPPLLKHVNVTVHEPAQLEGGGRVSAARGAAAALRCRARGDRPLALRWARAGRALDLLSYRWTMSETRAEEGVTSTLLVRAAEPADAGEYRCHASNHYGSSELVIYLTVDEPPVAPRGLRLGGLGTRWANVRWLAPAPAPAPARHCAALSTAGGAELQLHNLTVHVDDTRSELVSGRALWTRLERLRPATAYSVRLSAANHAGHSPPSEPLTFTTLDEAPSASPQDVRVTPAGSAELLVSWSAPPRESWNGEVLGYVVSWREERRGAAAGRAWAAGGAARLAGLRAATRHALAVRAYTRAGAGPASPLVYATTPDGVPELPPTSVSCEAISETSVRVRWSPPEDAVERHLRGYEVVYMAFREAPPWSGERQAAAAPSGARTAELRELRPGTNHSVWVRARAARPGPSAPPLYCATPRHDPGAVREVRVLAAGADALRVSWLAPPGAAPAYYTLHTRELGNAGGERAQRVEAGAEETWRELRGLRAAAYAVWVRAAGRAGPGAPSPPLAAAPAPPAGPVPARISSFGRAVYAAAGVTVRLRCAAVGTPPLRRRWTPPPPAAAITDTGDLLLRDVSVEQSGNYTCTVRNAGGEDVAAYSLAVSAPPAAPAAPRVLRADPRALHVAWRGAAPLGHALHWAAERGEGAGVSHAPPGEEAALLTGLRCGAHYRLSLVALGPAGASPPSPPLRACTAGDETRAAPGKEFVWANSSALRLNLLAWRAPCPVEEWRAELRPAPPLAAAWAPLRTDGESAEATDLKAGTWYEVRVTARSAAGDTVALYRAATLTPDGEKIGEAAEVSVEARSGEVEGGTEGVGAGVWLGAAAAGAALAALGAAVALRWERAPRRTRPAGPPPPPPCSTAPGKRNGGPASPPGGRRRDISPYVTFSAAQARRPPSAASGDSCSSGSVCAACAADRRSRSPAHSVRDRFTGSRTPPTPFLMCSRVDLIVST